MTLFDEAAIFSLKAHEGQKRKFTDTPFFLHPMEVAVIASSMTDDPEVLAAALLHDAVEDAGVSIDEIEKRFGKRVAALVASETEDKMPGISASVSWLERKKATLSFLQNSRDRGVRILWLSDKLANLRSFVRIFRREGNSMWAKLNQKDRLMHKWYYSKILEALSDLSQEEPYRELENCYEVLFNE